MIPPVPPELTVADAHMLKLYLISPVRPATSRLSVSKPQRFELPCPPPRRQRFYGLGHDNDVPPNRPVAHVVRLELKPFCERQFVASGHLLQAGHARFRLQDDLSVCSHYRPFSHQVGPCAYE